MNQTTQALLNRLIQHQYVPANNKRWSHVALFKEHARRMAWWADALGVADNWLLGDFARLIDPKARLEDEAVAQLQSYLQSTTLIEPMPDVLFSALRWTAVADAGAVEAYDLPAPYDAAIMLHLRGGFFRWNNRGFWEVSAAFGVGSVDIPSYKTKKAFVMLEEEELNLLDNEDEQMIVK